MSVHRVTITVEAHQVKCDGCGKLGPYDLDDPGDALVQAEAQGWESTEDDVDLCPECAAPPTSPRW